MIQRIQSLFLFLSALCMSVLFVFPPVAFNCRALQVQMYLTRMEGVTVECFGWIRWVLCILAAAAMVMPLISLFSYKRRPRQLRLCSVAFLLDVVMAGMLFLVPDLIAKQLEPMPDMPVKTVYQWACLLPVLAIAFTWLATKYIKRDEALVRAADRIR